MGQVNVVITRHIGEELRREITDVSPEIKLRDASDFAEAEHGGDFSSQEKFDAILAQAEVLYGFWPPKNVISRSPNLKWLHTMLAGVDYSLYADIFKSPVIVTNSRGIHSHRVSELVFEYMLMFSKQATLYFQMKQEKRWERFTSMVLRSKTVGILGLGNIGREIARLAKAFGMRVLAIDETRGTRRARNVDLMLPANRLRQLLAESDFVVVALPLTSKTNRFIGEKELRAMKDTAYLINIARGAIVDEDALIRALDEHQIAGAGLDVFVTEPLPPESRLWEFPNVIYSPHIAGTSLDYDLTAT